MDEISSGDEYYAESIHTDMLQYICDGIQSLLKIDRREAHYKILDFIKQIWVE